MSHITVTHPNGGEVWVRGETHAIRWESEGVTDNVRIWLGRVGGGTVVLAEDAPNTGTFNYLVPVDMLLWSYRLAVETKDHQLIDFSDGTFRVARPATSYLEVVYPNGGEVWVRGEDYAIRWESEGVTDNVRIWLGRAGGGIVVLDEEAPNTGTFNYVVPEDFPLGNYRLAVETKDHQIIDFSDTLFRVVRPETSYIHVVYPNGGAVWAHGETHTIRWNSEGVSGNLRIWLARQGGGIETLTDEVANTGTYRYTVPNDLPPGRYRLTVETTDHQIADSSDDFFRVVAKTALVTVAYSHAPAGSDWVCQSVECPQPIEPGEVLKVLIRAEPSQPSGHRSNRVFVELVLTESPEYPSPAPLAKYEQSYYDGVRLHASPLSLLLIGPAPVTRIATIRVPEDTPLGMHFLGAVVDAGNRDPELNETNNVAFCKLPVNVECGEGMLVMSDSGTRDHHRCVWDWTQPSFEMHIIGETETVTRDSPWTGVTEPVLEQEAPDNRPESGWRLLAKDFGTGPQPTGELPYFLLYNKYTSKIRAFFYVPPTWEVSDASEHTITAFFPPDEYDTTWLFDTGTDLSYATDLNRHSLHPMRIGLTHLGGGQWAYADFSVAYDPITETRRSPRIRLEVDGLDLTNFTAEGSLSGTARTLTQKEVEPWDELVEVIERVEKYYSTANDLKEGLEKMLKDTNKKVSFVDKILDLLGLLPGPEGVTLGKFLLDNLGALGGVAGLVSGIWNLVTDEETPSPITTFEGGIKIVGSLETKRYLGAQSLRLPGALPIGDAAYPQQAPIYDRTLGVLTLTTTPAIVYEGRTSVWAVAVNNLEYLVNPESGMRLRELYAAMLYVGGKNEGAQLERIEKPPEGSTPIGPGWEPADPDYPLDQANPPMVRVYRTRYVPFDRFLGLSFEARPQIYAHDKREEDPENPRPPLAYPLQIKGVKVLGVLERTDAVTSDGDPILHTFSHTFQPYITSTEQVLREEQGEAARPWEGTFAAETVGQTLQDYLGRNWFEERSSPTGPYIHYYRPYLTIQIHVGNLVVVHDKVGKSRRHSVFRRFDDKQFGFVEYRPIEHFYSYIERYINGIWERFDCELTWTSRPYTHPGTSSELEYVRDTLGYEATARYWSSSDSEGVKPGNHKLDRPGRYRIRVVAWSEGGDYHEILTREFQIIE